MRNIVEDVGKETSVYERFEPVLEPIAAIKHSKQIPKSVLNGIDKLFSGLFGIAFEDTYKKDIRVNSFELLKSLYRVTMEMLTEWWLQHPRSSH